MNNEIKEIDALLFYLIHTDRLKQEEKQYIANYINNLQEENNLLKAKIKCMEEITGHNQTQPKDESEIYNEMFR